MLLVSRREEIKTEKEKMLSGELYSATDGELVEARLRAKKLLKSLNVEEYTLTNRSKQILRELIPGSHPSLYIEPPFHCDYGSNIVCGENVYFNVNCVVLDVAHVSIGSNVFFGPGAQIYTATHPLDHTIRKTLESGKEVTIGDDCWIGGGAIILPGVKIGQRCVIGAGSVVTKDVPDDSLVAGNPAKLIRSLLLK
jgi:maltose O-acetyltransferase